MGVVPWLYFSVVQDENNVHIVSITINYTYKLLRGYIYVMCLYYKKEKEKRAKKKKLEESPSNKAGV